MNKILIYVLFIIFGLCIYLYLNKKDKFNISGQNIPSFMCSNEKYINHPDCLPDNFCEDLNDKGVCTIEYDNTEIILNNDNSKFYKEYYEILTNGIYEFIDSLGYTLYACVSLAPVLIYSYYEQLDIMNKLTKMLIILLSRWQSLDSAIQQHDRSIRLALEDRWARRVMAPIFIFNIMEYGERTSRELMNMLTRWGPSTIFTGEEVLDVNYNAIRRMIEGEAAIHPMEPEGIIGINNRLPSEDQLISWYVILDADATFIIKVIRYLNWYSTYFRIYPQWKQIIREYFGPNSRVYQRFADEIDR